MPESTSVRHRTIAYPWAYPGQTRALLSRATTGEMAVEWEGEAAPAGAPDETITYLWHAGTASGYGAHRFSFSVNGRLGLNTTTVLPNTKSMRPSTGVPP